MSASERALSKVYLCWDDLEEPPDTPDTREAFSFAEAAETFAEDHMGLFDDDMAVAVKERESGELRVYIVRREVSFSSHRSKTREINR